MRKFYFPIRNYYNYDFENLMVRNTDDVIIMLMETMQLISVTPFTISDIQSSQKIIVCIDKMQRIFWCFDKKIISVRFPFKIKIKDSQYLKFFITNCDFEFDNRCISIIKSIFSQNNYKSYTMIDFVDIIYQNIGEEADNNFTEFIEKVIYYLLNIEYGYLRYDNDIEHANGKLHPQNHFDINFSNSCTYKIGINNKIEVDHMIDFLDINTDSKFINI